MTERTADPQGQFTRVFLHLSYTTLMITVVAGASLPEEGQGAVTPPPTVMSISKLILGLKMARRFSFLYFIHHDSHVIPLIKNAQNIVLN